MLGSLIVYLGLIVLVPGLALAVRPIKRLRVTTRARGLTIAGAGALLSGAGLLLPAWESQVARPATHLDQFAPRWQFRERHTLKIGASPERVFEAIKRVRADEISLFQTLTWIRRGGRPLPEGILNAGSREAIIDVALRGGFVVLADQPPRELVIGTVVMAPAGTRGTLTPAVFQKPLSPGFALATMNFLVEPAGPHASLVSTETRVFANSPAARRRFAVYWRVIYPGSAIIRRMWLRAIRQRATGQPDPVH